MQQTQTSEHGRAVSQFMTSDPITGNPTSTVREISDLLFAGDIRHLPIVDQGRLVGMVSDRDVRSIAGEYLNMPPEKTTKPYPCAADFCEGDVISVSPEDDILDVIDLMLYHKVGAIPVVDTRDRKLVGIVSYADVLREVREAIA